MKILLLSAPALSTGVKSLGDLEGPTVVSLDVGG